MITDPNAPQGDRAEEVRSLRVRTSVFQPIITVTEGRIEIDFGDSYIWDVDEAGEEILTGPVEDVKEPEVDAWTVFDRALRIDEEIPMSARLRALADVIVAQERADA